MRKMHPNEAVESNIILKELVRVQVFNPALKLFHRMVPAQLDSTLLTFGTRYFVFHCR
uniref:Uncharacterized protein n=1 Tax=Anguilla anguilla TaxID=7936 RepID=A0A0E9WEB6_ANGAN